MLGKHRPNPNLLNDEQWTAYRKVHCSTCYSIRKSISWSSTLTLSFEAELTVLLYLAIQRETPKTSQIGCTALPVIPRKIVCLPEKTAQIVGAFSSYISWCMYHDHLNDGDQIPFKEKMISKVTSPHIGKILDILEIDHNHPGHYSNLSQQIQAKTIEDYLAICRTTVASTWNHVFKLILGSSITNGFWISNLCNHLSDILVLEDAVEDLIQDYQESRSNLLMLAPGSITEQKQIGYDLLNQRIRTLRTCLATASPALQDPWRSIAMSYYTPKKMPVSNSSPSNLNIIENVQLD